MKILVVFDQTGQSDQNLRLALEMARFTQVSVGVETELLVCVLELLREDKPLDDYLGEMDRATKDALMKVEHRLDEAADNLRANVKVKVLRGMDLEVTDLIAYQAKVWEADLIQVSVGEACASCKQRLARNKSPGFFSRFLNFNKPVVKSLPQSNTYSPAPVSLSDLLRTTHCRINVTCHGERLFTMYRHNSEVNSRQDKP